MPTPNYDLPLITAASPIAFVDDYNALATATDSAIKQVADTPGTKPTLDVTTGTAIKTVTGTPTTKKLATYGDLDALPTLLSAFSVSSTTGTYVTGVEVE